MKKLFSILATALAAAAANAAIDVIGLGYGETADVLTPGRVVGVECLSTVAGGTCNPKRETLVMTTAETVTEWATTNYSYTVVTTNDLGSVTNVLTRPHPLPYPDTMTGYWTNAAVTAWSVTNTVPAVGAAITNNVSTNAFLAPGDTIFTPASDTFRGKLLIYVER